MLPLTRHQVQELQSAGSLMMEITLDRQAVARRGEQLKIPQLRGGFRRRPSQPSLLVPTSSRVIINSCVSRNYKTGLPNLVAVVRSFGVPGGSSAALRSVRWTAHRKLFFAANCRQRAAAEHRGAL
jgi:hypothetical protein